jgi:hypothetical protein
MPSALVERGVHRVLGLEINDTCIGQNNWVGQSEPHKLYPHEMYVFPNSLTICHDMIHTSFIHLLYT